MVSLCKTSVFFQSNKEGCDLLYLSRDLCDSIKRQIQKSNGKAYQQPLCDMRKHIIHKISKNSPLCLQL